MSEWIKVEDRLPEADTFVLVYDGEDVAVVWWTGEYFGVHLNGQDIEVEATHWMPRPAPPEPA